MAVNGGRGSTRSRRRHGGDRVGAGRCGGGGCRRTGRQPPRPRGDAVALWRALGRVATDARRCSGWRSSPTRSPPFPAWARPARCSGWTSNIDGESTWTIALEPIPGIPTAIAPRLTEGRAPTRADEIAVGALTQQSIGKRVGDRVLLTTAQSPTTPSELTIVGTVVMNAIDEGSPGFGAVVAPALMHELAPEEEGDAIVVELADGADGEAARSVIEHDLAVDGIEVRPTATPDRHPQRRADPEPAGPPCRRGRPPRRGLPRPCARNERAPQPGRARGLQGAWLHAPPGVGRGGMGGLRPRPGRAADRGAGGPGPRHLGVARHRGPARARVTHHRAHRTGRRRRPRT